MVATDYSETAERAADWHEQARCHDGSGTLAPLFFSEAIDDINRAKAFCAECPVIVECFSGALERREPWGVWGGQLFVNGKVVAHKRPRGRPPKHPRPLDGPEVAAAPAPPVPVARSA